MWLSGRAGLAAFGWAAQRLNDAEEPKQDHDENNDDKESDDAIGSTHGFSPVLVQGSLQG